MRPSLWNITLATTRSVTFPRVSLMSGGCGKRWYRVPWNCKKNTNKNPFISHWNKSMCSKDYRAVTVMFVYRLVKYEWQWKNCSKKLQNFWRMVSYNGCRKLKVTCWLSVVWIIVFFFRHLTVICVSASEKTSRNQVLVTNATISEVNDEAIRAQGWNGRKLKYQRVLIEQRIVQTRAIS